MAKDRTTSNLRPVKIYTDIEELNVRQRKWLIHYVTTWNMTEASRQAGYNGTDNYLSKIGHENSQKFTLLIQPYLEDKVDKMNEELAETEKGTVMTLREIFVFWSDIINDEDVPIKERLRASEMLAKAQGGFIERIQFEYVENQNKEFAKLSLRELRELAQLDTTKLN